MKETIIRKLGNRYLLKERDMGELAHIHKFPYDFTCKAYDIDGVGNLFFIDMKAMFGLMKMETSVITPIEKDLDFCNLDIVEAMGNHTCMFEMYKTSLTEADLSAYEDIKKRYASLPAYESSPRWYDELKLSSCISKKGKKILGKAEKMMEECLDQYMVLLEKAPLCDKGRKNAANKVYVERLLSEGGAAVDSMNKILGPEKTARLIRTFMYHTQD